MVDVGSMITQFNCHNAALNQGRNMNSTLRLILLLPGLFIPSIAMAQTVVEYIHTDALGSIVAVTDENGKVIERRNYEPYGGQVASLQADGPGYTGHVEDATTGLTYMQQRYYDPALGRFLSTDPVRVGQDGSNFNRYAYVANNPYSAIDPDGRYTCKGSKELCSGVKAALKSIRASGRQQTGSRIPNSRSTEIANFYGKEGVDNGVMVQGTSEQVAGMAKTSGNTTTISINLAALQDATPRFTGFSTQDLVNDTTLHEGSHGLDQRLRMKSGRPTMTTSRRELMSGELRAYRAEAAYHQSMQSSSPWGLWTPDGGRDNTLIQSEAAQSVKESCGRGSCSP